MVIGFRIIFLLGEERGGALRESCVPHLSDAIHVSLTLTGKTEKIKMLFLFSSASFFVKKT